VGGGLITGPQPWNVFQADQFGSPGNLYLNGNPVDTSQVDAPAAVFQTLRYSSPSLSYNVPLTDGTYKVTLLFDDPTSDHVGQRLFDIVANGATLASNFDVFAAAGAFNGSLFDSKAVAYTFMTTASGGSGLRIDLQARRLDAILSGIEITRVNTPPPSTWTASLDVSLNNGATWSNIAAGVALDRFGAGSFNWTPTAATSGMTALLRVTATDGTRTVTDQLFTPFMIVPAGHDYYVNDGSTAGDELTTAVGNNLNSGKSPDKPVASLEALLSSYRLGAGDIVHIDTGNYIELVDLAFGRNASGTGSGTGQTLTIQGPSGGGAVLNRADTDTRTGSAVFRFNNADYVTFANLDVTGAVYGFLIPDNTSIGISILKSSIHDNTYDGVYLYAYPADVNVALTVDHSKVFNNANDGFDLNWANGITITNNEVFENYIGISAGSGPNNPVSETIAGNSVHDNRVGGIAVGVSNAGTGTASVFVTANHVFNNSTTTNGYGIYASGPAVLVSGNTVTGQGTRTGAYGIVASFGATIDGNTVSGNDTGIGAQDEGNYRTVVSHNRVFANSANGIELDFYGAPIISDNQIYSNNKGIFSAGNDGDATISGNLIYDNANGAIDLSYRPNVSIVGNTILQSVGTGISLANFAYRSSTITIADNIISGNLGTLVSVAPGATNLTTDYNLYYRGPSGTATLASLGGTTFATLADWKIAVNSQNQHSLEGDPKFIDMDGADNVPGGPDTALGGGADDNFTPGKLSPALDAANGFLLSPFDLFGQGRHDDPAVGNTGIGIPAYDESDGTSSSYAPTGTFYTGSYYRATDLFTYTLPFAFNFYGTNYSNIVISPAGFISFNTTTPLTGNPGAPSLSALKASPMIAPFWSTVDMSAGGSGTGFFVESASDHVTFRWLVGPAGASSATTLSSFALRLGRDGSIRFDYGDNLNGFTPVIGLSAGNGRDFTVTSISGNANLSNANSISFAANAAEGRVYYDIGAIEFQGASTDATAPTFVSGSNLPAEGGSTDAAFTSITLSFSEALDRSSALSVSNYRLIEAGNNGLFGDGDDVTIPVSPAYVPGSSTITLNLSNGPLANGHYRLMVSPGNGLLDTAGNPLDGDGIAGPGGAFVRNFQIDRSHDQPPSFANSTLSTTSARASR
jgi:hypothetical protein